MFLNKEDTLQYDISHDSLAGDFTDINNCNPAGILNTIRQRFYEDKIYTKLDRMTISVNPFCSIASLHDIKAFRSRHTSKDEDAHIFSIAVDAMEG